MRILLVFGGRSVEHEVSIRSAACIYQGLCANSKYTVMCAGIDRNGQWYVQDGREFFTQINGHHVPEIGLSYGEKVWLRRIENTVRLTRENQEVVFSPEVIFPITHGTYGEDGTLQGLFQQLDIPFVGCDVCASACAMDKDITKRLLRDAGVAVVPWQTIRASQRHTICYESLTEKLGEKLFIKPVRAGSSVGAALAADAQEFEKIVDSAFRFDDKILVEKCMTGREIEFAVLGNEEIQVSLPGEIVLNTGFYTYEHKYIKNEAGLQIPAKIDKAVLEEGREIARRAYEALGCEGMARVDFFLADNKTWFINEINTLPGFTSISMYPKLWETCGKNLSDLLEELIELALRRHRIRSEYHFSRGS